MEKKFITDVAKSLSDSRLLEGVYHHSIRHVPMPSERVLSEVIEDIRTVLFPGFFGSFEMTEVTMEYQIGSLLDRIYQKLSKQIRRGFCFDCPEKNVPECGECGDRSDDYAARLVQKLPEIRRMLAEDAHAAYEGDPAARSIGETIFCYPSMKAVSNYRIAHELFLMEVPLIPRMISELAHSETGIDIHPGATIAERFFIDHGTGVVIGETCRIGRNVRIYQGVTLGAKSFPLDENGNPVKGIIRHPTVEDDVVIYSNATILGAITIGARSQIAGNAWITKDVAPDTTVRVQQ